MMEQNFQEVILKKEELKTLKALKKKPLRIEYNDVEHTLLAYALAKIVIIGTDENNNLITGGTYTITDTGERYLIYRNEIRNKKISEWLRYIITTAIAIIALIRTL